MRDPARRFDLMGILKSLFRAPSSPEHYDLERGIVAEEKGEYDIRPPRVRTSPSQRWSGLNFFEAQQVGSAQRRVGYSPLVNQEL